MIQFEDLTKILIQDTLLISILKEAKYLSKQRIFYLSLVFLFFVGFFSFIAFGNEAPIAIENSLEQTNALREALENEGFLVQEGKLETFDVLKIFDAGLIPSCWGNNPTTPYMIYKLPVAPGQTAPNMITDVPLRPENKGLWGDNRFRPDEAVLFIGKTPPEVKYFSYRSYLCNRYFPIEGKVRRIFASLGDTLSNFTINTSGTPDDPFEKETIIISTADRGIDSRIREVLKQTGYSPDIINTDIIPHSLVKMGLKEEDDTFIFMHRIALFADEAKGEQYLQSNPGIVWRLTPKTSVLTDPFPIPPLLVRGTGDTSELDLMGAVDDLRQAIIDKYSDYQFNDLSTSLWVLEGYDAIQRGVDVLGETRDAVYLITSNFSLADNPDDFVILYGVNHGVTGKVIYSNIAIYGAEYLNGVNAVIDQKLIGTAEEYLPAHPEAKYLYVWKVARRANGDEQCLDVPWGKGAAGVELDQEMFIGYRAYIEKATKVGPNWSEILYDRAIHFTK